MTDKIDRWESALSRFSELEDSEWSCAFRQANPTQWGECEEDEAAMYASEEFEEAAEDYCLGKLVLDFPNSQHGDAMIIPVYRLPRQTVVLVPFATWEFDGPSAYMI